MEQWCRYCEHSRALEYDENWKVLEWYCEKFKEKIASYVLIINCPGYEEDSWIKEDDD